jgi:hypothetical protein
MLFSSTSLSLSCPPISFSNQSSPLPNQSLHGSPPNHKPHEPHQPGNSHFQSINIHLVSYPWLDPLSSTRCRHTHLKLPRQESSTACTGLEKKQQHCDRYNELFSKWEITRASGPWHDGFKYLLIFRPEVLWFGSVSMLQKRKFSTRKR